jgi:drug/metabolite transporter (DMT)-like permease
MACWGTSPLFIRLGLVGLPSAIWGVTIGLAGATAAFLVWWVAVGARSSDRAWTRWRSDPVVRTAIGAQVVAGVTGIIGTAARAVALTLIPIVVAIPLAGTSSLFTLMLAPLILGRKLEKVTPRLVAGALLLMGGSILVVVGRSRTG